MAEADRNRNEEEEAEQDRSEPAYARKEAVTFFFADHVCDQEAGAGGNQHEQNQARRPARPVGGAGAQSFRLLEDVEAKRRQRQANADRDDELTNQGDFLHGGSLLTATRA